MSPDAATIHARRWWTLSVLCLSLLIIFVGNTTLNVAIPDLSRDLNATTSELQWVVASYSLVFAGLLFSTGALGDRYGRKGMLQLGLAGFFISSLLAAASHDMTQLIICRSLMGASAAMIDEYLAPDVVVLLARIEDGAVPGCGPCRGRPRRA